MVKSKTITHGNGLKQVVPVETITRAYCSICDAVMDVDGDGTCMECSRPIAFPAIRFEDTKFTKE